MTRKTIQRRISSEFVTSDTDFQVDVQESTVFLEASHETLHRNVVADHVLKTLPRNPSYQQLLVQADNLSRVSGGSKDSDLSKMTPPSVSSDNTLATEISSANEALERIKIITSRKSPALRAAVEDASRTIQETYYALYRTRQQLLDNVQRDINPVSDKWNLVSSTLAWAGRLSNTELRWLHKKRASKAASGLNSVATGKSLIRMSYAFILAYSNEHLENKKHTVGELNKFFRPLNRMRKQLYELGAYHRQNDSKEAPQLKNARELYERIISLLNEKVIQEEEKKKDIDNLRSSILAQTLRIHFDEWKQKMYKPEEQSERLQALRDGREKRLAQLKVASAMENQDTETHKQGKEGRLLKEGHQINRHRFYSGNAKLEEEAANLTIEDLETMLNKLKQRLAEMMNPHEARQPLSKSHSLYGSSSNMQDISSRPVLGRLDSQDDAAENLFTPRRPKVHSNDATTLNL